MEGGNMLPPFFTGQKVIAVNAYEAATIKNGRTYVVSACYFRPSGNPIANGKSFWYVEITDLPNHPLSPSIFAPIISDMQIIEFCKAVEIELQSQN